MQICNIKPVSQKGENRVGKSNQVSMKSLKKISCLLVLVAVLFSSCSKDEDESSSTATTLTTADLTAKIPTSLATKSPQTSEQLNEMISLMGITEAFQKTKPSTKRTGKIAGDTWTSGGYTIIYTDNDTATQHVYTYTIKQGSVTYYTIAGWENKNGSAGHWVLDMSDVVTGGQGTIGIDFDWTKNSSNDFNLDMLITAGAESGHLVANINHDSSGNIKGYEGTTLSFESTWNSSGSGQYTDYGTNPATITKF